MRPTRALRVVPTVFGPNGGAFGGPERHARELARHVPQPQKAKVGAGCEVARPRLGAAA